MTKKIVSVGIMVVCGIGIAGMLGMRVLSQKEESTMSTRLTVVTTLFPLYDFAKAVGGEHAEVTLLLPPGVESHAFEPKPSDIVKINEADIFAYTGKAMEPWAEDLRKGITSATFVVDASDGVSLIGEEGEAIHEEESHQQEKSHDAEHHPGGVDPHIWLDFDNAAKMISSLEKAFIAQDPSHAAIYRSNAQEYQKKLSDMDQKYRDGLALCATREIVYGGHYAFGYLVHRYGLAYTAAQGLAPDAEPSAKDVAALIDQIKKNNMRFVFYEELTNPKIAGVLAQETGAKMLLLNAAHNIGKDDYTKGVTFLGIMEENLSHIREGLACK